MGEWFEEIRQWSLGKRCTLAEDPHALDPPGPEDDAQEPKDRDHQGCDE